jgi:hypothetical protein
MLLCGRAERHGELGETVVARIADREVPVGVGERSAVCGCAVARWPASAIRRTAWERAHDEDASGRPVEEERRPHLADAQPVLIAARSELLHVGRARERVLGQAANGAKDGLAFVGREVFQIARLARGRNA